MHTGYASTVRPSISFFFLSFLLLETQTYTLELTRSILTDYVFAVKLGPKLSETVKGKLSLGKRIIQQGGRGNIFKQIFGVNQGEELLKASQCYLSTTAGPISGLLFISTEKLAFCSERSITVPCATNNTQLITTPYKVIKHIYITIYSLPRTHI